MRWHCPKGFTYRGWQKQVHSCLHGNIYNTRVNKNTRINSVFHTLTTVNPLLPKLYVNSLNPRYDYRRKVLLLQPLHRWELWESEKLGNLSKSDKGNGRAESCTQVVWPLTRYTGVTDNINTNFEEWQPWEEVRKRRSGAENIFKMWLGLIFLSVLFQGASTTWLKSKP